MAVILGQGVQQAADQALASSSPVTMADLRNKALEQANIATQLQQHGLELQMKQAEAQRYMDFSNVMTELAASGEPLTDKNYTIDPAKFQKMLKANPVMAMELQKQFLETAKTKAEVQKNQWLVVPNVGAVWIGEDGRPTTPPAGAPPPPEGTPVAGQGAATDQTAAPVDQTAASTQTPAAQGAVSPTPIPGTGISQPTLPAGGGVLQAPSLQTPTTPSSVTPGGVTQTAFTGFRPSSAAPAASAATGGGYYPGQVVVPEQTGEERNFQASYKDWLAGNNLPDTPANKNTYRGIYPPNAEKIAQAYKAKVDAAVQELKLKPRTFDSYQHVVDVAIPPMDKFNQALRDRTLAEVQRDLGTNDYESADKAITAMNTQLREGEIATDPRVLAAKEKVGITIAQAATAVPGAAASYTAGLGSKEQDKVREQATKINTDYNKAQEVSQTMGAFIAGARGGNKAAYSVIPLEGALQITTASGTKRINRNEIEAIAGAGSLWDRIVGGIGKGVSGASISGSVLNDLDSLTKTLAQNAKQLHDAQIWDMNNLYGSTVPTADGYRVGDTVTLRGKPVTITKIYRDGRFDYR